MHELHSCFSLSFCVTCGYVCAFVFSLVWAPLLLCHWYFSQLCPPVFLFSPWLLGVFISCGFCPLLRSVIIHFLLLNLSNVLRFLELTVTYFPDVPWLWLPTCSLNAVWNIDNGLHTCIQLRSPNIFPEGFEVFLMIILVQKGTTVFSLNM